MELSDLIKGLERMLPEKVPYGDLICAEGLYAHSGPLVYEDPEPYFIEQAITELNKLSEIQDMIQYILGPGCDADHLRELIQADREEKCLILPCKVGDTVYKFDASICKYRDKDKCDEYCDGFQYRDCWEGSQIVAATNFELKMLWSFGKTVFPTREEAEAALEKMKGGTHGNK